MLLMRDSDNVTHYSDAQSHSTLFSMQETIPQRGKEEGQGLSSVNKRITKKALKLKPIITP